MLFMPESPYHMIMKGNESGARNSLQWLRGKAYNIEPEMEEMKKTHKEQMEIGTVSIGEFLSKREYILPCLIMLALMFFQQYSGINAVLFYLTDIFISAGSDLDPGLAAFLVTLMQVSNFYSFFHLL